MDDFQEAIQSPQFLARFWSKVQQGNPHDCWSWHGANVNGRGQIWFMGRTHLATRLSLSMVDPTGFGTDLYACHTCDNPNCVNPAHLWWGNSSENMVDCAQKGRLKQPSDTCLRGHPRTAATTYVSKRGWTECRICRSALGAERRKRDAARAALNPEASHVGL
jgi:hypothetical protein